MCVNRVTIRVSLIIVIVRTGPISFNSRYNRSQSNISHRNNCGNGFQPDHREKLSAYTIIKYKEYLSNETIFNFQRTNERNLICEAFGVAFAGDHAFALGGRRDNFEEFHGTVRETNVVRKSQPSSRLVGASSSSLRALVDRLVREQPQHRLIENRRLDVTIATNHVLEHESSKWLHCPIHCHIDMQ